MRSYTASKDPGAKLDYGFRWDIWPDDDGIDQSTWIVPDGLAQHGDSLDGRITMIWLSGGVLGSVYPIINRITTAGGRQEDRTIHLRILENIFPAYKDPDDETDYAVNWKRWLGVDVITASTWILPVGLTLASATFTASTATAWIDGGQIDQVYMLKNRIVTAAGRINLQTIRLTMRQN